MHNACIRLLRFVVCCLLGNASFCCTYCIVTSDRSLRTVNKYIIIIILTKKKKNEEQEVGPPPLAVYNTNVYMYIICKYSMCQYIHMSIEYIYNIHFVRTFMCIQFQQLLPPPFCLFSRSLEQWGPRPNEACAPPPPLRSRPIYIRTSLSSSLCVHFFLPKGDESAGRSMSHSIKIMPQCGYVMQVNKYVYRYVREILLWRRRRNRKNNMHLYTLLLNMYTYQK